MLNINKILISRTDKLGDLVLTLPLAAFLKKNFPQINISYLVRDYALPIAASLIMYILMIKLIKNHRLIKK